MNELPNTDTVDNHMEDHTLRHISSYKRRRDWLVFAIVVSFETYIFLFRFTIVSRLLPPYITSYTFRFQTLLPSNMEPIRNVALLGVSLLGIKWLCLLYWYVVNRKDGWDPQSWSSLWILASKSRCWVAQLALWTKPLLALRPCKSIIRLSTVL